MSKETSGLNRRRFLQAASAVPILFWGGTLKAAGTGNATLTAIDGLQAGHFTDPRRPTGCTVVLAKEGATAGVDVRGSAPGTRETDLLNPVHTIEKIHAVLLSGGSAFGLAAASGVVRWLEENQIGYATRFARVPLVPAAILYDLGVGDPSIRPDEESGYQACRNAGSQEVAQGNVGAGAGATVGKLFGIERAMKGGLGSSLIEVEELQVGAIAAVNCVGDVVDPETGRILAGVRTEDGKGLADAMTLLKQRLLRPQTQEGENTTLVVVGTNAAFSKPEMSKLAQMSHDGLARAIRPVHLPMDGDTVFALSTGRIPNVGLAQAGALAAEATAQAVVQAVLRTTGIEGFPSHQQLQGG